MRNIYIYFNVFLFSLFCQAAYAQDMSIDTSIVGHKATLCSQLEGHVTWTTGDTTACINVVVNDNCIIIAKNSEACEIFKFIVLPSHLTPKDVDARPTGVIITVPKNGYERIVYLSSPEPVIIKNKKSK